MLPCHALLVLAALCGKRVFAQPRLTFPINAQLPAVAVADEIFSFTFSADTFSSELNIDYSLGDAPAWLQLEGTTRTLIGEPSSKDIGDLSFQIVAKDATGSATSDSRLVVLGQNSLRLRQDVYVERFSQAGRYSAPSTLLLYPQSPFRLTFGPDVFEGSDASIQYYASSDNNTPLPAWLAFDPGAVAFVGTTPPLLTPQSSPQSFTFNLAASQIAGFSQSTLSFQISVTNHILAFLQPTHQVTVAPGEEVTIPPLLSQLQLDGSPLDASKVTNITSNQPPWLQLKSEDLSFSGSSPEDLKNTSFRLAVADEQNNLAFAEFQLVVASQENNDTAEVFLGAVNATIGEYFSCRLADTSTDSSMHKIDVDLGSAEPWLSFTQSNLTLQGIVPSDSGEGDFNVTLAVSEDGQVTEVQYLTIKLVSQSDTSAPVTPNQSATKSSAVPTSTTAPSEGTAAQGFDDRTRDLVLMIALPILAFLALCLLVFMLWKRRRPREGIRQASSVQPPMQQSSRPSSTGSFVGLTEPEARSLSEASFEQLPSSPPPRVDLPWQVRERPRNRLLSVVDDYNRESPETRSSWDEMLMEVDRPARYGPDVGSNRLLPSSPGASSRLLSSPESSRSPVRGMDTLLTERSGSFSTPRKFNGRQSNGLGHGTGSRLITLRQVPLSPLSETSGMLSTPFNPIPQPSITPNYKVLHPNTSFTTKPTSTRGLSLASSESRYAAPASESSSEQALPTRRRRTSSQSSSSRYEDDEWTTEGSASAARSSSQHVRHPTGGRSLAFRDMFAGNEAARQWPLETALPTAASQGVSLRSQVSERSQGDSLRFI